jgi:hypothetical protein
VIRIKGRFFNYSLINKHAPTNDLEEEAMYQLYEQLERVLRSLSKSWLAIGDGRRERRKSWPGNRTTANDRQAQSAWEYKSKGPQTGLLWRRQANVDQKYVLHAQTNPSPNLELPYSTAELCSTADLSSIGMLQILGNTNIDAKISRGRKNDS